WIGLALSAVSVAMGVFRPALPVDLSAYASTVGSFSVAALLSLLIAGYGFFDARRVRIERVRLASPKLSKASGTFRLALISDVHLGALVGARRLRRLIARLQKLDADVVVSVGDLVD